MKNITNQVVESDEAPTPPPPQQSQEGDPRQRVGQQNRGYFGTMDRVRVWRADAKQLKLKYNHLVSTIIQPSEEYQKKINKETNIPKFILKVFVKNLPNNIQEKHSARVRKFIKGLAVSKTRFDLNELFGLSHDPETDAENLINRSILRRILQNNFDNILRNSHIRNKKLYLFFCKKMMHKLDYPELIDRLDI